MKLKNPQNYVPAIIISIFAFFFFGNEQTILGSFAFAVFLGVLLQTIFFLLYAVALAMSYWIRGEKFNRDKNSIKKKEMLAAILLGVIVWAFFQYSNREKEQELKACVDEYIPELEEFGKASNLIDYCWNDLPGPDIRDNI